MRHTSIQHEQAASSRVSRATARTLEKTKYYFTHGPTAILVFVRLPAVVLCGIFTARVVTTETVWGQMCQFGTSRGTRRLLTTNGWFAGV